MFLMLRQILFHGLESDSFSTKYISSYIITIHWYFFCLFDTDEMVQNHHQKKNLLQPISYIWFTFIFYYNRLDFLNGSVTS